MFDPKKYRFFVSIGMVILLSTLPVYLVFKALNKEPVVPKTAEYVGRETCIDCHIAEYNDWLGSDHDKAMDWATDSTVLGNFVDGSMTRENQTHKAYMRDGKFYVYTDGADGSMQEFEIKYVFGYDPLQQYLVEFEEGRLQTLALTWNSKDSAWYYMADSVYQGLNVDHTNWLHWTNQAQNWNSMCADCHSTNLKMGYNPETNSYHTTWSEIDVSCEACHGPASLHLDWAKLPDYARGDIENTGLLTKTSGIDHQQYVDLCARCHSRRASLSDFHPEKNNIYSHMIPILPVEPNFYVDGQIKEEDYVYASFTQSRMFVKEIKCNDCHNVHSGKLLFEGNNLCLQCHRATDYNTFSHTHHKSAGEEGEAVISVSGVKYEVGSGTECINCHMHAQYFMGVDYRNDHSFRIPRPDLSEVLGTPNACNQCHNDKTNQWSQSYIEKWFGSSRPFQFGEAFFAAQQGEVQADSLLRGILSDELYPLNIRSAALNYLSNDADGTNNLLIRQALLNNEALMRISAIRRLNLNAKEDLDGILPLLVDENKAVRIEVVGKLMGIGNENIPEANKKAFQQAQKEYLDMLLYNADFPTGKYNLGNYYYHQKDYNKAEKFYLQALEQDDELTFVMSNLAHLYGAMGHPEKAEDVLFKLLKNNPNDGQSLYSYGLILSENKKYQESIKTLIKASEILTQNSRVDYNIAMLYDFFGDKKLAQAYLEKSIRKQPDEVANYGHLLNFLMENQLTQQAQELLSRMLIIFPENEEMKEVAQRLQVDDL
jgi:predicted CXXCH cytochrome family protein